MVLERGHYVASFGVSEAGSPTIETDFGDLPTTLQFGDCNGDPPRCTDIAFIMPLAGIAVPSPLEMTQRMIDWPFVKLYIHPDTGEPGAEMDITFVSGDPEMRLTVAISLWRNIAKGLLDGIPERPWPSVLSTDVRAEAMVAAPSMVEGLLGRDESVSEEDHLKSVNPKTLAELFFALGYNNRPLSEQPLSLAVAVDQSGAPVIVDVQACHWETEHCGQLVLVQFRSLEPEVTPELLNEFNIAEWFLTATVFDDGLVFMMDIPTFDGLSQSDLNRYLEIWKGSVEEFYQLLEERG
ncbi:MAG: YbjN domain-containing protein [Hyphomicrobiales bacterium]|nr:YbjN domain-containing protein [Hyphomicrobiales bacterium]